LLSYSSYFLPFIRTNCRLPRNAPFDNPEPDESSPNPHIAFKPNFNIILASELSFPSGLMFLQLIMSAATSRLPHTHTHTHSRAHSHTHAHAHTLTHTRARAHTLTHAHTQHTHTRTHSLTHTHTHTHTHAHTLTHTHTHSLTHTLTHTRTHSHTHTHAHTATNQNILTICLSTVNGLLQRVTVMCCAFAPVISCQ